MNAGRSATVKKLLEQAYQARRSGDAAGADAFARQAEAAAGVSNAIDMALALAMRAQCCRDAGDLPETLTLLQQAALACNGSEGEWPQEAAFVLRHLADVTRESGRFTEAAEQYRRTLAILRNDPGTQPLTLANTLRGDAITQEALDKSAEARAGFREAKSLYEQTGVNAGTEECQRHLDALESPRPEQPR